MEVPDSSRTPRQFKSESLRTNEEFVRLYNDATEARRLSVSRPRVVGHDQDYWGLVQIEVARATEREWKRFQDEIWDVDQQMKRVEKYALLSEVLAGIVLRFEREIFPILRRFPLVLEKEFLDPYDVWVGIYPIDQGYDLQDLLDLFADSVSSGLESAHKVVVSALTLLSFVYQYLIGCVDKGGSKIYSSGSFLFRLIFVAIVLFLGSYVWIKFRQESYPASRRKRKLRDESDVPGRVYRRVVKNASGSVTHYKYEPRFKPLREKLESGASLEFSILSLGSYNSRREAEIVLLIAAVLYGEVEGRPVQFEDGDCLPFPSVTEVEDCPPCGKEKAYWVTRQTKQLYIELQREKARREKLLHPAVEADSHHGHGGEARRSDFCPSSFGAPSTAMELTYPTSPHGGNGVVQQPTTSECHVLGQEPAIAPGAFSNYFSDFDYDQIFSSCAQGEENQFLAMDDLDQIEGDYPETDRGFGIAVPAQSSALDIPTSSNLAIAITSQQLESLPEGVQLHQRVTCQETRPEKFGGSKVDLRQELLEYEGEISVLREKLCKSEKEKSEVEQKLRKSEVENEKWRSKFRQCRAMLCQFAKLIPASDEDGNPVDVQESR